MIIRVQKTREAYQTNSLLFPYNLKSQFSHQLERLHSHFAIVELF